jgi:hypothetical protein
MEWIQSRHSWTEQPLNSSVPHPFLVRFSAVMFCVMELEFDTGSGFESPFINHFTNAQAVNVFRSMMKLLQYMTSKSFLFLPLMLHQLPITLRNGIRSGTAISNHSLFSCVQCVIINEKFSLILFALIK